MTYEETVAYLAGLEVSAGWDLKLERMRAALARRGHPEARWPALHVAGTNGKGSTAAMLDAVLTAAGYRSGLYTSPHLVDFTERIRVGGRTIPRAAVVSLLAELRADLEAAGIALTHFEFATLIAFEWFARLGIDVGVIEVGLGGRLDATNLVGPAVTAITSIALRSGSFRRRRSASSPRTRRRRARRSCAWASRPRSPRPPMGSSSAARASPGTACAWRCAGPSSRATPPWP